MRALGVSARELGHSENARTAAQDRLAESTREPWRYCVSEHHNAVGRATRWIPGRKAAFERVNEDVSNRQKSR